MISLSPRLFSALSLGGTSTVLDALQQAALIEHSTMPPYLYALYSLDRAKNGSIATIIKSVVMEEMLHMTLACNLINALGGSPVIDSPSFVPSYPGHLPGGIEGGLTVHLAPFSLDQLKDFMTIEEPENPLQFPFVAAAAPLTIGQYYAEIKKQILALGPGAFTGDPARQIGTDRMDGAVVVTNAKTAVEAIDTIVEQGEGTAESPLEAAGNKEYAHYYRFAEILHGGELVLNPNAGPNTLPDQRYFYDTKTRPIAFDPTGVYKVPTDPKVAGYPVGSPSRRACEKFNYAYTTVLKALHAGFNGQPTEIDTAIALMTGSLRKLARDMMSGKDPAGINVGPSFEYQPVAPP